MNQFGNNVKKVMIVFLFLFIALISYIAYFQAFKAPALASDTNNKRIWVEKNNILRGTIYDRNLSPLTSGEKTGALTQSRNYIGGDVYVHALGYVNQTYGTTGLEKLYNGELTTHTPTEEDKKDSIFYNLSWEKLKTEFKNRGKEEEEIKKVGNGVVTTLNPTIQQAAYDALGSNKGAAVALNPKTGEVLAMVSKPTYDPNNLEAAISAANSGGATNSPLINRATNGLYPPGSTFKVVTATSALENIPDVLSRTFDDSNGYIQIGDKYSLSNDNGEANGYVDLKGAFLASSNVVFGGILARELGSETLKETAEKFGFNKDIPKEGFGLAQSKFPLETYPGVIAQSGIGQGGILATPMQMALVASTIANDGVMMTPKLVNSVVDSEMNEVKTIESKEYGRVLSAEHAAVITDFMKTYVDNRVYGSWSFFEGTNACAKTGTATVLDSNGNKAEPHGWFIAFAPAEDPQIAVAVIVENAGYGGQVAAPVAAAMINAALGR